MTDPAMTNLGLILLQVVLGIVALGVAFGIGRWLDRRRDRSLAEREARLAGIVVCQLRSIPAGLGAEDACLVMGSTVMACDAFKFFLAKIINLIGGNVEVLEGVLHRARREATCRMLEAAEAAGAGAVWNVRLTTAHLGTRRGVSVEVLCYGTALRLAAPPPPGLVEPRSA